MPLSTIRNKLSIAVPALLFAISIFAAAEIPGVGAKAPDFTLSTPEGQSVRLSDLTAKGSVVLIFLRGFPGYQCPYCQKQAHDFQINASKFAALNTHLLLVYPGPPADLDQHAKDFLSKEEALPANFHLVIDPDYKVTNQYSLRWDAPHETAYPSTFLIDPSRNIFYQKVSHSHADRTSAEDILTELKQSKRQP